MTRAAARDVLFSLYKALRRIGTGVLDSIFWNIPSQSCLGDGELDSNAEMYCTRISAHIALANNCQL